MFLKVQQNELKVSNPNSVKGLTAGYIRPRTRLLPRKSAPTVSASRTVSPL